MKKIALVSLAALALAGCAATGNGGAPASTAVAGTQYCWQDRLEATGGKLTCNWAASRREACEGLTFTTVEAARYAPPRKVAMCANGQWLVELAPRG